MFYSRKRFHYWIKHFLRHDRPVCLAQNFPLSRRFLSHRTIFCAESFTNTHTCCLPDGRKAENKGTCLGASKGDLVANSGGSSQSKNMFTSELVYCIFYSAQAGCRILVVVLVQTGP
jgi:hypothetical protein